MVATRSFWAERRRSAAAAFSAAVVSELNCWLFASLAACARASPAAFSFASCAISRFFRWTASSATLISLTFARSSANHALASVSTSLRVIGSSMISRSSNATPGSVVVVGWCAETDMASVEAGAVAVLLSAMATPTSERSPANTIRSARISIDFLDLRVPFSELLSVARSLFQMLALWWGAGSVCIGRFMESWFWAAALANEPPTVLPTYRWPRYGFNL